MINIKKLSALEISKAIKGEIIGKNTYVDKLTIDSRELTDGSSIFFAIRGEKYDGHMHVEEAIKHGAKIIVSDVNINVSVTVIKVQNTTKAFGLFAKKYKRKAKIIAVTGSSGKTTTKNMIISVLKQKYTVCGTHENQNNEIGVPLTLLSIKNEDICVVEMGMRKKGDIDWLSYISDPDICVVTNCGSAHIEYLETKENIVKAKMEIINFKPDVVFLPNEEKFKKYEKNHIRFVYLDTNDTLKSCFHNNNGITFEVMDILGNKKSVNVNSICIYNSVNALFAYRIGEELGLKHDEILNGLLACKMENRHEDRIDIGNMQVVLDCYNASFEGVKMALYSIVEYSRKINKTPCLLLGDMLELGDDSDRLHIEIGKYCLELGVRTLFTYGNVSRIISKRLNYGIHLNDINEALDKLLKLSLSPNVLLVKGSRKMQLESIVYKMKEEYDE